MSWFYSKDSKEARRQATEYEREKAANDRLSLIARMDLDAAAKINEVRKTKDKERADVIKEKDDQIRALQAISNDED